MNTEAAVQAIVFGIFMIIPMIFVAISWQNKINISKERNEKESFTSALTRERNEALMYLCAGIAIASSGIWNLP